MNSPNVGPYGDAILHEADSRLARARVISQSVDGWLTEAEGDLLERLASDCPPGGAVVEIGSWKGKSTIRLAGGLQPGTGTRVFAIDPHEQSIEDPSANTLQEFLANLRRAGVVELVTPVVAASEDAAATWTQPPWLLFLDGNHLEEPVTRDLQAWLPRLRPGGVFVMHDVLNRRWPGPRKVLRRALWTSRELGRVHFVDSIAYARKLESNGAADRLCNRWCALLLLAYEAGSLPLPVSLLRLAQRWFRRV